MTISRNIAGTITEEQVPAFHITLAPVHVDEASEPPDAFTIPEAVQDLFHYHCVTTDYVNACKAREQRALTPGADAGLPLPAQIRDSALRFMLLVVGAKRMSYQSWFQAVSLLDTYFLKAEGSIELLPTTCVCLVRLVKKLENSLSDDECATWLPFTQQLGEHLETIGFQVPEVTEESLGAHELMIWRALSWQLDTMSIQQWIAVFSTRFNLLSANAHEASLSWLQNQTTAVARMLLMRVAASLESSHFDVALGLFCLGMVWAHLLPLDSLRCADVSPAEMTAAYMRSQPAGAVPVFALGAEQVAVLHRMVEASTCSELHVLQQATQRVMQLLGAALHDIRQSQMQRVHAAQA